MITMSPSPSLILRIFPGPLACALFLCAPDLDARDVASGNAPAGVVSDPAGDMVLVPAGEFIFGSDDGEADEQPRQRRHLPAFLMDVTEVTNAAYARFVDATGHPPPPDWPGGKPPRGREKYPVVNVSWDDASAFASWAKKRLPAEIEWERAARGTDGRRYPWGDANADSKHNMRESADLVSVDALPEGRSPAGCLNLFGNAWEWCADWYGPYSGSLELSIHFGQKYRVFRGGGSIGFYGIPLPRSVAARGRGLPFARYDGLGFRCARDAAPERSGALSVPLQVREEAGVARKEEIVTCGVPFPRGSLRSPDGPRILDDLRIIDGSGKEVPLQARTTGTWRDGSIRWALLDFPVTVGAGREGVLRLEHRRDGPRAAPPSSLRVIEEASRISVETGAVSFVVPRDRWTLLEGLSMASGSPIMKGGLVLEARTGKEKPAAELVAGPPSRVEVTERGPLRAAIEVEGPYIDAGGPHSDPGGKEGLRYLARIAARAGAPEIELRLTVLNLTENMVWIRRLRLSGRLAVEAVASALGGDREPMIHSFRDKGSCALFQESDARFSFASSLGQRTTGTRAPGWFELQGPRGSLAVAVEDFWENFPMRVELEAAGFAIDFWPEGAAEPFDADSGIAKTYGLLIRPHAGEGLEAPAMAARLRRPLVAVPPAAHLCSSRAFGLLEPYDFDVFSLYEALTEQSADLYLRERPHGMRHFGDFYYGGPYKGKNAYGDLEYDYPFNYAMQYARTGLRKYLDAAIDQARHQADIDVNHRTGMQYKHSPRHTETEADMGHVFLRGLIAVHHLTGDRRLMDVAREIGDWLGPKVARSKSQGNERQIGWALYALTGIYEATWEPKYLDWAKANVDELLAGLGPTGKFDIRWDNRIAFFQGIATSGFLRYYEATGDERVAEATLRLSERMLGYYPEYLGRTLEGLAWSYERSRDRRFLELLERTYETSMLRAVNEGLELGAGTIFTVHALPFIQRTGLERALARPLKLGALELSSDRSLHRHHIGAPAMALLLDVPDEGPFDLVVVRSGCTSDAAVTVRQEGGKELAKAYFSASAALSQRRVLELSGKGVLRVGLETLERPLPRAGPPNSMLTAIGTSWDIITTRPLRAVFHSPDQAGLETLTPRLFFRTRKDADRLSLKLTAKGEGFHGAVLHDPRGNVAAVSANFIDLEDKETHEYALEAPIPPGDAGQIWSLDLQSASLRMEGAEPWYATSLESFFAAPGASGGPSSQ